MENLKRFLAKASTYYRAIFAILMLGSIIATPAMAQSAANSVICSTIQLYNAVQTAIFIIGLMLMILGGALYAASHIMPGQSKGTMQGYGMGMILGGVIGVIIAIIAPYIFGLITSNTVANALSNASAYGC
jgi:hypothetical protein